MFGGFQVGPFQPAYQQGTEVVVTPARSQGAGGGKAPRKPQKKRWWQVGDKVYLGTQEQAAELLDAFLSPVDAEIPDLPEKPAPVRAKPKPETVSKVEIPDLPVWEFDWRPLYVQAALARDLEFINQLEQAILRRLADEDDAEVILLLH